MNAVNRDAVQRADAGYGTVRSQMVSYCTLGVVYFSLLSVIGHRSLVESLSSQGFHSHAPYSLAAQASDKNVHISPL
jgi:hypothetical protein